MIRIWLFHGALLAPITAGIVLLRMMEANGVEVSSPGAHWMVLAAFALACGLTPAVGWLVRRLGAARQPGAIDRPGGTEIHDKGTLLTGGLSIYLAFTVGVFTIGLSTTEIQGLVIAQSLVFLAGLIEDRRGLSASWRLTFQAAAVLVLIRSGVVLSLAPHTWWGITGEWCLTFLWVVGITNAFRFLDGLDGLAGGSAAINSFFIGIYAFISDQFSLAFCAFLLMAATLGFLPFNFKPHRRRYKADIFLGASGSTFLGFTLAGLVVAGNWAEELSKDLMAPVLIMAVPISYVIITTVGKVLSGKARNPVEWIVGTGREQFLNQILGLRTRKEETVAIIYLVNLSLGISAFLLMGSSTADALLVLGQVTIILSIIGYALATIRKRAQGERQ